MRIVQNMNTQWFYAPNFSEEYIYQNHVDEKIFKPVCLPHTNIELPYNYFDEADFQFVSCYKKQLFIPKEYKGKKIYLDFEGVMTYAKVYTNGKFVGEHKGGYTPFSIDITEVVRFEQKNMITVVVDSTERSEIPPFGGVIDYLTFGGIYREVSLRVVEPIFITDIFIKTPQVLDLKKIVELEISINNIEQEDLTLVCTLIRDRQEIQQKTQIIQQNVETVRIDNLEHIVLWDMDHPVLYKMVIELYQGEKKLDQVTEQFGFREAIFKKDGFYLNGKKVKLVGLNRHQSYPYVGYAMPKRAQQKDADILKNELGLNMVRTSHYPQSRHFLDRCDEIGLLVFEEIPGWQHIGDEEWQKQVLQDVKSMILRDRNRPSIVIWGVRINESSDHHELYTKTNEIARKLDPTRQTGGVRCIEKSEFLEDVYTMNDFIHSGGNKVLRDQKIVTGFDDYVPYMVTEYNGHMYPTKKFDQEERVLEHALRHARVQNASHMDDHMAGAIGWCAFDYNTHSDFGSGDKICYHGVMDMYRLPKFASYVYRSQKDPKTEIVLEPVTYWSRGDRNGGSITPFVILTNCDSIEFYYGGQSKGKYYPNKKDFAGLSHPPIIMDELSGYWGDRWNEASFVGYINDQEVIRRNFTHNPIPTELSVKADDDTIGMKELDVTRVVVEALDQCGNTMTFLDDPIYITVDGAGELIGPHSLSFIGGSIAFWVKNKGVEGDILIQVESQRFDKKEIMVKVVE